MRGFRNLSLFKKLILAFGLVGVLVAGLGCFSVLRLADLNSHLVDMNENWMPAVRELLTIKANILDTRTFEYALSTTLVHDKDTPERATMIATYTKASATLEQKEHDLRAKYEATITGSEERALWQDASAKLDAFWIANDTVLKYVADGDGEGAIKATVAARTPRTEATNALQKVVDFNTEHADTVAQDSRESFKRNRLMLIGSSIILVALGLGMGFLIARSISKPLRRASEVATAIARGQLDNEIVVASTDETGQLLASMQDMQAVIKEVVAAQEQMAKQHDAGAISYRIAASAFPGTYCTMASQVNEMVAAHIAVKMRVVDVVKSYANGDFSVDMEALPGEKAAITAAIDGVKRSFAGISSEVNNLVAAAGRGDFSARGDEKQYQNEFRRMIEGLNRLMETSDVGLSEVARVLSAIANGNLTDTVRGQYHGTFAQLQQDANRTVAELQNIVGEIRVATESINSAAKEISTGNSDLSSRTEQQAASLEETASSMEELTATVKQNAESAREANTLALGAGGVAAQGGQVVEQVVTTMHEISESSKRIADIIGVIDGIAFQTNILALNAAVEAARAGDQGRGFAVVASEVRSLAHRSAQAAKEIKDLISTSTEKVEAGTRLVDTAGQTMQEVVGAVQKVTNIMREISQASIEQSNGIEQVNQAVSHMDQTTQQNAALVEEAAAAAESMEEQTNSLAQQVARFRLPDGPVQSIVQRLPAAPLEASNAPRLAGAVNATSTSNARRTLGYPATATGTDDSQWQEF